MGPPFKREGPVGVGARREASSLDPLFFVRMPRSVLVQEEARRILTVIVMSILNEELAIRSVLKLLIYFKWNSERPR